MTFVGYSPCFTASMWILQFHAFLCGVSLTFTAKK